MNSAQRLELIKGRLKTNLAPLPKPPGMAQAINPASPRPIKKPWIPNQPPINNGRTSFGFGLSKHDSFGEIQWVETPDKKPKTNCAIKRKARVSPLTKISEQLPMKLPR